MEMDLLKSSDRKLKQLQSFEHALFDEFIVNRNHTAENDVTVANLEEDKSATVASKNDNQVIS